MAEEIPTGEGLTFEKVWLMFQETSRQFKETDRQFKETERKFEKMRLEAEKQREKDRIEAEKQREKDRIDTEKQREKEREKDRIDAEKQREKDRWEADEERRKSHELFKQQMQEQYEKTNAIIGRLGNKLGEFVEGVVRPGVVRMFNERGIPLTQTFIKLKITQKGQGLEADIVGVNGEIAVVVEVKSTLEVPDVKEHLERLEKFKTFFPHFSDKKLVGAVAGMVMDDSVSRYEYRQGLYVIAQNGETVQLLNDQKFKTKRMVETLAR